MRTGIFRCSLAEVERKKKLVNKQTKAETKGVWGERESRNGRRENRTNIKMTIEANRWGEREN